MALITLDPNRVYDYIPKFDRKNTTDPLVVKLKYMSHGAYVDFMADLSREMASTNNPDKQTEISKAYDRKMFCDHVKGFENWFKIDGNPGTNEVEEFYDTNDKRLIYEINSAIQDSSILTEGQRKN